MAAGRAAVWRSFSTENNCSFKGEALSSRLVKGIQPDARLESAWDYA